MWNNASQNVLLLRDDVGKSKPPSYPVPEPRKGYGEYRRQPEKTVKERRLASSSDGRLAVF